MNGLIISDCHERNQMSHLAADEPEAGGYLAQNKVGGSTPGLSVTSTIAMDS